MKCDELKAYDIDLDYPYNDLNGSYYDKHDVDDILAAKDKEIVELKAQLESEKASRYADSVDAGMRERRLRRALYKACANWAHHRVFVRYKTNEKAWENVERKCRAKAEQYQ